jgi:rfaE bifunctional protein nucleotidyltransferase chain/domain
MSLQEKIVSRADLAARLHRVPRPLIFTNGVFDLLHPGHVTYLEEARTLGASLLVGLNSDQSARQLGKGADRPINNELDRATMLAALESVSLVCLFDERTPLRLIEEARPDCYVKGGDYDVESLEETILIRSWGGEAKSLAFLQGHSTTSLLERIQSLQP